MSLQTNVNRANTIDILRFFFAWCFILLSFSSYCSSKWQTLTPGIEYQDLEGGILTPWSHIYAFKIDPKTHEVASISAHEMSVKNASVDQFAQYANALISINGGFFDRDFNSLGLRISNKTTINPLKAISWWGVFYIKNNKPHIVHAQRFSSTKDIDFAIQSGPRLLIKGVIPSLKQGIADRSALGITADGKIIILVSSNAAMTTNELAHLLKSPPLYCTDAINLDGGSSSQLYAHINSFHLNLHGFSNVGDAIVVRKK